MVSGNVAAEMLFALNEKSLWNGDVWLTGDSRSANSTCTRITVF